jgi:APA family basic amino acid/polyamine antiporter
MPTEKKLYPNWIPVLGLVSCVVLAASQRPITITAALLLLAVGFWLRMVVRRFDAGSPTLDRP